MMTDVWLDPGARAQIERESRARRFFETGGPLFGFEDADSDELVIVGAGGPGPRARHRAWSFTPDQKAVNRAIAEVHEVSEGRYAFLGSWHTHPRGRPHPSGTDTDTAEQLSNDPDCALPKPVIVIHATTPLRRTLRDSNLRAFRWSTETASLEQRHLRVVRDGTYPALPINWATVVD